MSKYTTELRFICETAAGLSESSGYDEIDEIISVAREKIFSFEYPIFDTAYKSILETKIIKHFYTREIGQETAGLFKLFLNRKMNEIMPYYNQLYESARLEFNPFIDADYTKTGARAGSGEETGETSNKSENSGTDRLNIKDTPKSNIWEYFSDTPQGSVTDLASREYLTTATNTVADGEGSNRDDVTTYGKINQQSGNTSKTSETSENYTERVTGKMPGASYSTMLKDFRETIMNIDMQVIADLEPLFMGVW